MCETVMLPKIGHDSSCRPSCFASGPPLWPGGINAGPFFKQLPQLTFEAIDQAFRHGE